MSQKQNNAPAPEQKPREEEGAAIIDDTQEAYDEQNSTEDEAAEMINRELADIDALNQQLADAKAQVEKEKKEYLFLMAEFDNFRKRTVKEKAEIIKNAAGQAMKGLLPIVDDFERGLEATKDATDAAAVREGMELIYQKLVKYMETNGVKPMLTNGEAFDPESHEAIAQVPAQNEEQKGKIIDTVSKGYTINGKVLRHAKVVVAQ